MRIEYIYIIIRKLIHRSFFDSVTSVEDGVFDIPEECYANSRVARDLDSVNSLGSVDPDFKIPQDLQSVLDIIMA